MLWILLLLCLSNITFSNGGHTNLFPAKNNSKLVDKIARRILEEIKSQNSSEQVDIVDKRHSRPSHLVTTAIKQQTRDNNNNNATRKEKNVPAIENKEKLKQDMRTDLKIGPLTPVNTLLPAAQYVNTLNRGAVHSSENIDVDENTHELDIFTTTYLPELLESQEKLNSGYSDVKMQKVRPLSFGMGLIKSTESDESTTTILSKAVEALTKSTPILGSDVDPTVINASLNFTNRTKQKPLFFNNNMKSLKSSPHFSPNLSHLKEVNKRGAKNFMTYTKLASLIDKRSNVNKNSEHSLLPNRYVKLQIMNSTSLKERNTPQKYLEGIEAIPAVPDLSTFTTEGPLVGTMSPVYVINKGKYGESSYANNARKPLQNDSSNKIDFIFIENLNINFRNTNGFNDYEKVEQDKNNNSAQNITEKSVERKWKDILRKVRSMLNTRSYKPSKHDAYSVFSPEVHYRSLKDFDEDIDEDRTPISVDYYFERKSDEKETEYYSDELTNPIVEGSRVNFINFDQHAEDFNSSPNEVMLNVLRDMIKMNSRAIVEYPWLKSVTDVSSGIIKLIDLIQVYIYNQKIHPLDLELLKYVLYLHKSSTMRVQTAEHGPHFWKNNRQSSRPGVNVKQVPILTSLVKNVETFKGANRLNEFDRNVEDQQVTILFALQDFLNEALFLLEGLHRKIQELANEQTHPRRLYYKLKDAYLGQADDQQLRVLLLHISLSRLFERVDGSPRLQGGFSSYVRRHPDLVNRDKREFEFILNVMQELHWK